MTIDLGKLHGEEDFLRLLVRLGREAWEIVSARLSSRTYVFSERVRMRPSRRITKAFRRCKIRKKGCGRASFHSLRATFISLMDEAGVQPYLTDAITGHAAERRAGGDDLAAGADGARFDGCRP